MVITLDRKKIRVKVCGSGTHDDPFRVDLPTYMMIPGSEEFDRKDPKRLVAVEVLVPADELDAEGWPDPRKVRRKYKGQMLWDRKDVLKDLRPPPGVKVSTRVEVAPRVQTPAGPEPAPGIVGKIKKRLGEILRGERA